MAVVSKVNNIFRDELDPEDLNPAPRGGQRGRISPTPAGGAGCLRLMEAAGFGGVVVATLAAALMGRCRR